MAIDPYPSNRPDPTWDGFTAAHDLGAAPQQPATPPAAPGRPVLPDLDVNALIRTVTQTQQIRSAIVDTEPAKLPVWAKGETAKVAYWSAGLATLVTGCANLSVHQWGMVGPGWTGVALTAGSTVLGVSGLNHHWDMKAQALMFGVTVGGACFTTAATGSGWMDVVAWLIGAAGTLGFKVVWNRKHAGAKAKEALTLAKVRTETLKGDALATKAAIGDAYKLLQLQEAQRAAAAAATPAIVGATPEERALRCAVWDVFGQNLISCDVRYTRTGYVATVGLPVALGRDAARGSWDKVNSALRADGRFIVSDGRLSNELDVKFLDRLKADTAPMPWSPEVMPAPGDPKNDPRHFACIGVNTETGDRAYVQFDERLLVCGASGTGKSWSVRPMLAHAHTYGDLVILDGKGEEGNVWGDVCRVGNDQQEIDDLIDAIHAEMNERKAILKAKRLSVWNGDQLTVFVDEGQVILSLVGRDAGRLQRLRELSSLGRSRGIVLWWATQKPTMSGQAPGIDSQMAGNMLNRFSLRVATEQEARTALDDCAHYGPNNIPDDRSMRGHGYLKGFGPSLIRTWTMDDAEVRRLPVKVWQGGSEATPQERAMAYLAANPGASNRAVAAALGIPESTLRKSLKGS